MDLTDDTCDRQQLAIVGQGRLGSAIARNLGFAESVGAASQPFGRGFNGLRPSGEQYRAVLLCVPDGEIAQAAAAVLPGPIVGHCSGATGLSVLAPHEAFSIHPLMTVTTAGAKFNGAGAAVDATTPEALGYARTLAQQLAMEPFRVLPQDRTAYHAAASVASNFLVTLEAAAEQLAQTAGVPRRLLAPLVMATVENWASQGAQRALTGPVARGDTETVERQREAVAERKPEFLPLFDALVRATATLADQPSASNSEPVVESQHQADVGAGS